MSVRSRRKPKAAPTMQLRMVNSADPASSRKKYPKSARHAKSNTNALTLGKGKSRKNKNKNKHKSTKDDSGTFVNIKPSSTRSSKYQNSKRMRSRTSGNVFSNGSSDEDDEKAFFGAKSKSKGKKKNKKGRTQSDEIDLANEFALPEFIVDHSNDAILNATMTVFEIKKEYNIQQIEETFKEFAKTLENRKQECVAIARKAYDDSKYISISIDIEGTHEKLSQIGTTLGEKEFELNKEQTLCVDKLREIIYFEDHSADASLKLKELQKTLAIEANKMEQDKAKVKLELAKVEPQLRAAKEAVSGIPKSSLDEFRALRKPSPILVDVVRAVAILVGKEEKKLKTWPEVRKVLDSKFIDFLLTFDAKHATAKARKIIEVKYLDRDDFTFERINKASRVAGPFVFWLASQISYAKLLEAVSPIQMEVDRLQRDLRMNEKKAEMLEKMLIELGKRVKECRYEMMDMVRKIVKLQDDIKEARSAHIASSPTNQD